MAHAIENLRAIKQICEEELFALTQSIDQFRQKIKKICDLVNAHEMDLMNNIAIPLIAYDKLVTTLTTVMEHSRKLNMFLKLNDLEKNESGALFQALLMNYEWRVCNKDSGNDNKSLEMLQFEPENLTTEIVTDSVSFSTNEKCDNNISEDSECGHQIENEVSKSESIISTKSLPSFPPVEEIHYENSSFDRSSSISDVFNCSLKNFTNYKPGDIIDASITYIPNLEELFFFIIDNKSVDAWSVAELREMVHMRQYKQMPPSNEVFGIVVDKVIMRAVRSSGPINEDEPCTYAALLLDFGEVINANEDNIFYILPPALRDFPAQAMFCRLLGINNKFDCCVNEMQESLQRYEYKKAKFKVVTVKEEVLELQLIEDVIVKSANPFIMEKLTATIENQPLKPKVSQTSSSKSKKKLPNGLNQEDMDMLYEEPLNTSNAMIATMGYVPKDESRLCPFFNRKTRSCFKGVKCKLEHTARQEDGWTKDMIPAATVTYNPTTTVRYTKGDILNITPTHICNVNLFYAQINDTKNLTLPLIWDHNEIKQKQKLQTLPQIYELVLALYEDGLWYRAKILERHEQTNKVNVLYVDYGNKLTVHLRDLARCDPGTVQLPFRAQLCRIADVRIVAVEPDMRKIGVDLLCRLIINKTFNMKVVSHHDTDEILLMRFIDTEQKDVTATLMNLGLLKPFKSMAA